MKVLRWLPGARMLASYKISWLRRDVVAGIVLTTLLVPQGMAYAELAGLPPITGHRGRRSRSDRVDARVRALAAAKSSPTDTRRSCDRRIALAGQHTRNCAALASAACRVSALNHGISWCGPARCPPGHRDRGRALDPQRLPTSMVAVPYHTRPRTRVGWPSRSATAPRC